MVDGFEGPEYSFIDSPDRDEDAQETLLEKLEYLVSMNSQERPIPAHLAMQELEFIVEENPDWPLPGYEGYIYGEEDTEQGLSMNRITSLIGAHDYSSLLIRETGFFREPVLDESTVPQYETFHEQISQRIGMSSVLHDLRRLSPGTQPDITGLWIISGEEDRDQKCFRSRVVFGLRSGEYLVVDRETSTNLDSEAYEPRTTSSQVYESRDDLIETLDVLDPKTIGILPAPTPEVVYETLTLKDWLNRYKNLGSVFLSDYYYGEGVQVHEEKETARLIDLLGVDHQIIKACTGINADEERIQELLELRNRVLDGDNPLALLREVKLDPLRLKHPELKKFLDLYANSILFSMYLADHEFSIDNVYKRFNRARRTKQAEVEVTRLDQILSRVTYLLGSDSNVELNIIEGGIIEVRYGKYNVSYKVRLERNTNHLDRMSETSEVCDLARKIHSFVGRVATASARRQVDRVMSKIDEADGSVELEGIIGVEAAKIGMVKRIVLDFLEEGKYVTSIPGFEFDYSSIKSLFRSRWKKSEHTLTKLSAEFKSATLSVDENGNTVIETRIRANHRDGKLCEAIVKETIVVNEAGGPIQIQCRRSISYDNMPELKEYCESGDFNYRRR